MATLGGTSPATSSAAPIRRTARSIRERRSNRQFRVTAARASSSSSRRSWTVRRIDDSISHVSRTGNLLLATGYSWDSSVQREGGHGLAGYALDGRKHFHVFEGRRLTQLRIYGGRAYVGLFETVRVGATHIRLDDGSAFKIVDLASGRIIGTRTAPLPILLDDR
jgi:hypothetical protein